jgi:hypothetical protein
MGLINARMDAHASNIVAHRHYRDAQRDVQHTTLTQSNPGLLPPPPPHSHLEYPAPTYKPPIAYDQPFYVPSPRGQPHQYGMPAAMHGHLPVFGVPPSLLVGQPFSKTHRGTHSGRGGRRLTIDPVVIGHVVHEATCFDKDALNRSIKMAVPTIGSNTYFKQWKRNFLTFLSLKAAYLIPKLAIRESGVSLDEQAQNDAYAMLLHAASEDKRDDQPVKCVSASRPDYASAA